MNNSLFYITAICWTLSGCAALMTAYYRGKVKGLRECKKIYETALQDNLAKHLAQHLQEHIAEAFTDMGMVEIPKDQIPEAVRKRIEEVRARNLPTKH